MNLRPSDNLRQLSGRPIVFACAVLVVVGTFAVPASSRQGTARPSPSPRSDAFDTSIKPFLKTYCYGCHRGNQPAAGFDLTVYDTQDSVLGDQRRWNLVLARLRAGEMPPSQSRQQPDAAQRQAVIDWIETINADYDGHSRAASAVAEEYFRAETVLAQVLRDLGL